MFWKIVNYAREKKFKTSFHEVPNNSVKLFWWKDQANFGDSVNYDLVKSLSSSSIDWVPSNYSGEYFMAIGSILQNAHGSTVVWGSGLINDKLTPFAAPKEILAVRGPLTKKRLLDLNIKCPDIFGDPALVLPEIFFPKVEREFDLGIIPHFVDKESAFFTKKFPPNIKVIDIEQPSYQGFISDVLSCKQIVSSSLHGIVVADAYDIPSLRVSFSNKIFGGDFKFNDYYLSIKRELIPSFKITGKTTIQDILDLNFNYTKTVDIRKLMEVNPFS